MLVIIPIGEVTRFRVCGLVAKRLSLDRISGVHAFTPMEIKVSLVLKCDGSYCYLLRPLLLLLLRTSRSGSHFVDSVWCCNGIEMCEGGGAEYEF